MPKNNIIITLGLLIALLPVFGFPHVWESVFQVIGGLSIVLLLIWANIDKRLSLKAKAQRRQIQKVKPAETNPLEQVDSNNSVPPQSGNF